MISVSIMINGNPIFTRSAVNQQKTNAVGQTEYLVDEGSKIYHCPEEGAVKLAKMMLDTIKEQM